MNSAGGWRSEEVDGDVGGGGRVKAFELGCKGFFDGGGHVVRTVASAVGGDEHDWAVAESEVAPVKFADQGVGVLPGLAGSGVGEFDEGKEENARVEGV